MQNENFSANSLTTKLNNSVLKPETKKKVQDFYSRWLIYADEESHKEYRQQVMTYLNESSQLLADNALERIFNESIPDNSTSVKSVDFALVANNICRQIMALVFGVNKQDYKKLIEISRSITDLLYGFQIDEESVLKAFEAINTYKELVNQMTVENKLAS